MAIKLCRRNEYILSVIIKWDFQKYFKSVWGSVYLQDEKYFISRSIWNLAQVCVVQPKAFL